MKITTLYVRITIDRQSQLARLTRLEPIQGSGRARPLTEDEAVQLINAPDTSQLSGLLYRALLAVLIGCRLRVKEASALTIGQIQQQPHGWVIVHADAKTPRSRITPMPAWVKVILDQWLEAAGIGHGHVFRRVNDHQVVVGDVCFRRAP